MTDSSAPSKDVGILPFLRRISDRATKHDYDMGTYWNACEDAADEIERLTAALAACQTYDYRQIIEESDRLRAALADHQKFRLCIDLWFKNWRRTLGPGSAQKEMEDLLAAFSLETGLKHGD